MKVDLPDSESGSVSITITNITNKVDDKKYGYEEEFAEPVEGPWRLSQLCVAT